MNSLQHRIVDNTLKKMYEVCNAAVKQLCMAMHFLLPPNIVIVIIIFIIIIIIST